MPPLAKGHLRPVSAGARTTERFDILDFDVITHGRYHHQAEQMRKQIESLKTAADKRTYGSQWGFGEERPALVDIDLILSRFPYDGEVVLCRVDVTRKPLEQNTGKASGGTMAVVEVNKDLYEQCVQKSNYLIDSSINQELRDEHV
ncbi:hypothetical protein V8E54_007812 [Elaphomyces granulatus]|jgi:hypothetical protein